MNISLKKISAHNKDLYEKRAWIKMINSLSGFKSANLVGSSSKDGISNLAMISSVFHLGATPPLLGFIVRPHSNKSPRHTFINIKENTDFTINHVRQEFYKEAHQSSARYASSVSEFEACGLTEEWTKLKAPYVKEAHVKIGLRFLNTYEIQENSTHMIVGNIQEFFIPEGSLSKDGHIDLERAGSLCVSGLDSYHSTQKISRLNYAKTDIKPHSIDPLES